MVDIKRCEYLHRFSSPLINISYLLSSLYLNNLHLSMDVF